MTRNLILLFILPVLNLFSFDYELSICAELNNDDHLIEWIEINKINKVDHFYLVDLAKRAQEDSIREILNYYSDVVTIIDYEYSQPFWLPYRLHKVLYEKNLLSSSRLFILTKVSPNSYKQDDLIVIVTGSNN